MFATLYLPRFALQAALRFAPAEATNAVAASPPVALVDADAKRPVVLDMTAAARREGVELGLSVPQALARCASLLVRYRSSAAEAMADETLFHCAYSLSPRVERQGEGVYLIDLQGAAPEVYAARCQAIVAELESIGLVVRIGIAATSSISLLAAKRARPLLAVEPAAQSAHLKSQISDAETLPQLDHASFLESLPIAAAEPGEQLAAILDKWGLRTVGAFAALSRDAVGARLGVSGLQLWDRVTGKEERQVAVTQLAARFEEKWDFEYEVDSLEPLLFLLRRFLDQLCLRLRLSHKVADRLAFELKLAYGDPIAQEMKVPEPTFDAEALFRLAEGRMQEVETDSLVVGFALVLTPIPFRQRQLGLFESSLKNPHRFAQTLARVAGIVGADRVGRPELEPEGRPDGFRLEAPPAEVPPLPEEASLDRHYGFALRRFRPALEAAVELQGRQPVWFRSEAVSGFVKACRGPWLHSGHWWESSGNWNRVEWDVELNKGGVYRLVKDEGKWYLEGEYD